MKKNNKLFTIMLSTLLCLFSMSLFAQDKLQDQQTIEQKQKQMEDLYIEIYRIVDTYPDMTYDITYVNDELVDVEVMGVSDKEAQEKLIMYFTDLEHLKKDIYNLSNAAGIYYVTETEPKPAEGFKDFYQSLHRNLSYPEKAKELGVEGTVFVKFVVDDKGNVENVTLAEDIKDAPDYVIEHLKSEAKEAIIASSGEWTPSKVAGIPVSHWVVLPVQFKLKQPIYNPIYNDIN